MGQALRRAAGRVGSSRLPEAPSGLAKSVVEPPPPPPRPPLPPAESGGVAQNSLGVSDSEGVSTIKEAEGVLEERDPSYDAMLNKMVGTIKSKPGGKLEMGEAFIVEKYKRPLPKLRGSTVEATTGNEQKSVPPGSLTIAQLQQVFLLHQGKSDEHKGPMEVQEIARKFNIEADHVARILQFVSLPPEGHKKGVKN